MIPIKENLGVLLRTCVRGSRLSLYARTQRLTENAPYRRCYLQSVKLTVCQNQRVKMTLWKIGRAVYSGQLARSKSAEDAVLCPSDMMLCVISYWVLSGAKRRQIQQLRCCVLPRQAVETEGCLSEINTTQRTSRNPRHL